MHSLDVLQDLPSRVLDLPMTSVNWFRNGTEARGNDLYNSLIRPLFLGPGGLAITQLGKEDQEGKRQTSPFLAEWGCGLSSVSRCCFSGSRRALCGAGTKFWALSHLWALGGPCEDLHCTFSWLRRLTLDCLISQPPRNSTGPPSAGMTLAGRPSLHGVTDKTIQDELPFAMSTQPLGNSWVFTMPKGGSIGLLHVPHP